MGSTCFLVPNERLVSVSVVPRSVRALRILLWLDWSHLGTSNAPTRCRLLPCRPDFPRETDSRLGQHHRFGGIPKVLQCPQFVGILAGKVVCLRKILVDVVEFPLRLIDVEALPIWLPRNERHRRCEPTVLVDAAAGTHFEDLLLAAVRRICITECVGEAHAFNGHLWNSIENIRCSNAGYLQKRRCNVDDVLELATQSPPCR